MALAAVSFLLMSSSTNNILPVVGLQAEAQGLNIYAGPNGNRGLHNYANGPRPEGGAHVEAQAEQAFHQPDRQRFLPRANDNRNIKSSSLINEFSITVFLVLFLYILPQVWILGLFLAIHSGLRKKDDGKRESRYGESTTTSKIFQFIYFALAMLISIALLGGFKSMNIISFNHPMGGTTGGMNTFDLFNQASKLNSRPRHVNDYQSFFFLTLFLHGICALGAIMAGSNIIMLVCKQMFGIRDQILEEDEIEPLNGNRNQTQYSQNPSEEGYFRSTLNWLLLIL